MAIIGYPAFTKGVASKLPVCMEDPSGAGIAALTDADVTVKYAKDTDVSLKSLDVVGPPSLWTEVGEGWYLLALDTAFLDTAGGMAIQVDTAASGNPSYRVATRIDDPLDQTVSGYGDGTVGATLEAAGAADVYECHVGLRYDYDALEGGFLVWLTKNGLQVTTPTSCQLTVKDEDGATVIDELNSSPDSDGFFKFTKSALTYVDNKVYSATVKVTHEGVDYTSGDAVQLLS